MVGDRMYDIDAARPNDIPCVGVLYGKTTIKQELIDHEAAAIVEIAYQRLSANPQAGVLL